MASLFCKLSDRCSGCDRLHLNRAELEQDRIEDLKRLGLSIEPTTFVWIQAGGLRDRLEFTVQPIVNGSVFGLFDKTKSEIVDIDVCPQLSPAMQEWLTDFRKDLPKVPARRSVRLRVSPTGLRGAWLDFANEDIRDILDEETWLSRQLKKGVIIEVGQRRKRVVASPDGPRAHRLVDATLEAWFETPIANDPAALPAALPAKLFGTIGTFTQPGFQATDALVTTVMNHIGAKAGVGKRIAEFGAGIGCFTLPLLASGSLVDVFESDRLALAALEKGVAVAQLDATRLTIHAGDFILSSRAAEKLRASATESNETFDIILVDPPRSGLGTFIESISARAADADWIYVSCYPESLAKDALALAEKGLKLNRLTVVEQFPFTRHFEIVATFSRS